MHNWCQIIPWNDSVDLLKLLAKQPLTSEKPNLHPSYLPLCSCSIHQCRRSWYQKRVARRKMKVIRKTGFTLSCNMQIFCSSLFEYFVLILAREMHLLAMSAAEHETCSSQLLFVTHLEVKSENLSINQEVWRWYTFKAERRFETTMFFFYTRTDLFIY